MLSPAPDLWDARTHVLVRMSVGDYRYKGYKTFGVRNGCFQDAIQSIDEAGAYIDNLERVLSSLE